MNKFSISFALFTLGFAAFLSACSDDGGNSPADLCKNGPSKDCLVGEWRFDGIEEENPNTILCRGNLSMDGDNRYSFEGGCGGTDYEIDGAGNWSLDGANIRIDCDVGDCADGYTRRGTVTVSSNGMTMSIRNNDSRAAVSWYKSTRVTNPTEKFTRK